MNTQEENEIVKENPPEFAGEEEKETSEQITANAGTETDAKEEKKEEKNNKLVKGILLGTLIGILLSAIVFVFWRGFVVIPVPYFGTVTIKLPNYGKIGESASVIDANELQRKLEEIDYFMDHEYYYETDREELLDAAVEGIYKKYTSEDGYSDYFTKKEYEEQMESLSGSFVGIGIYVVKDDDTGGVKIVKPIKGGPAEEAGLKEGDIIISADGTNLCDMELDVATSKYLKGVENTTVHIQVIRDDHIIEFNVQRRTIETESVYYSILEQDGKRIGYLYVAQFLTSTINGYKEAMDYFTDEKVDGIIVDLRDNTGGDMNICLDMCDYYLKDDIGTYTEDEVLPTNKGRTKLLSVEAKNGKVDRYYCDDGHSVDIPIVVLVNNYSASASEIFSGVMHSYGYRLCGLNTYGKGIVQTVRMLYDMSGIKYTSAQYVLPDGSRIHGVGIKPDNEVEPSEELKEQGADAENPDPEIDNMLAEAIRMLGE